MRIPWEWPDRPLRGGWITLGFCIGLTVTAGSLWRVLSTALLTTGYGVWLVGYWWRRATYRRTSAHPRAADGLETLRRRRSQDEQETRWLR